MKSLLNVKNLIAIALILFGTILAVATSSKQVDNDVVSILDIKQPSEDVMLLVKPIARLVTDPTDRARLAIFNQEFATRVMNYTADNQQTNDIYVLAASHFFKEGIKDKYDGLDGAIVELLKSSIGDDNHILTTNEKTDISAKFMGLAWALIQKQ